MNKLKTAGIAALSGQVPAILLMLIAAVLLRKSDDPAKFYTAAAFAAAALSGLICGLVSLAAQEKDRLPVSLISGALLACCTLLLSFLPGGGGKPVWQSVLLPALQFLSPLAVCLLFPRVFPRANGGKRRRGRGSSRARGRRAR